MMNQTELITKLQPKQFMALVRIVAKSYGQPFSIISVTPHLGRQKVAIMLQSGVKKVIEL